MKLTTRFALVAATLAFCAAVQAQTWPAKPVKIIVPYPPGGAVDVVTRKMAAKLQEQTGQSFFVENKAGATGTIGLSAVVQAPADGYTLAANDTTYALLPHIFKKLPFDYQKDLLPVGAFVFAPMGVVVKGDSKYKTLGDMIAAAKTEPNRITYGTAAPEPRRTSSAKRSASPPA
jgi:tripartite-type tricarboxylate transporter receptor subunit TctC